MQNSCDTFNHYIAEGNLVQAALMIQDGFDIDHEVNSLNQLPIIAAITDGNMESVKTLVEFFDANFRVLHGCDFLKETAIVLAARRGSFDIADFLIDCLERTDIPRKTHAYGIKRKELTTL